MIVTGDEAWDRLPERARDFLAREGTGALADDTFRRRYAERVGTDESSLRDRAVLDPAATVTRDVERLRSAEAISPRISVSGHVYDVVTGLVQTIVPAGR